MADKNVDRAAREAAGGKSAKADKQAENKADKLPPVPDPVDVVHGIPDRSARPAAWKYLLIGVIFAAWVGVLVYFLVAGPR